VIQKIETEQFLSKSTLIPVIDVRSPGEYLYGHIPGAINVPLFDDPQRVIVGTKYKKEGREAAIIAGLDLIGPNMSDKLDKALKLAENKRLLVHCWRGGMRSEAMAWLFSLGGIEAEVLNGGYKAYRNYILGKLSDSRRMVILGGLTGSGKTDILKNLREKAYPVIDLEGLANHKGSAFGAFGQKSQPTSEYFGNLLFNEWEWANKEEILWVEDESKTIGTVFIPDPTFIKILESPVIALIMDIKVRLPRLMEEYSLYPREELIASVRRISKRLGGDNSSDAIVAIENGDFAKAIEITLSYYDKAYMFGLKKRKESQVFFIHSDTDNIEENSMKVLEASKKLKW
jgi:tRNA 2-selenouridine synthase